MKNKRVTIIAIVSVISCVLSLIVYSRYFSDKAVFDRVLTKYFDLFVESSDSTQVNNLKLITDTNLLVNSGDYKKDLTLTGNLYTKVEESKIYLDAGIKEDNKLLLGIKTLLEDNKFFAKFEGISDEFLVMDYVLNSNGSNDKNPIKVYEYLKDALIDSTVNHDYDSKNKIIELDGDDYKTKAITLNMNYKMVVDFIFGFIEKINTDEDTKSLLNNAFDSIVGTQYSTIEDFIEAGKEASRYADTDTIITYTIYVYGKDQILRQAIDFESTMITMDSYENKKGLRNLAFTIHDNNEDTDIINMEIKGIEKDKSSITVNLPLSIKLSGYYVKGKDKVTIDLPMTILDESIGNFNFVAKTIKENEEYNVSLNLSFDYGGNTSSIKSEASIFTKFDFPTVDVSKNKPVEEITEIEQQKISDILTYLAKLFGVSTETDY